MTFHQLQAAKFYGILDLGYVAAEAACQTIEAIIQGGVQIVQLRGKDISEETLREVAMKIQPILRKANVPLIINDHVSLAAEIGADGAHVGQDDAAVAEARRILGSSAIIGKSTHSLEQAIAAEAEGANYIGVGPIFATPTKPGRLPVGLELIAQVAKAVRIPQFCIGGINLQTLDETLTAGAQRVVIVSGLLQAKDIAAYGRQVSGKLKVTEQIQ